MRDRARNPKAEPIKIIFNRNEYECPIKRNKAPRVSAARDGRIAKKEDHTAASTRNPICARLTDCQRTRGCSIAQFVLIANVSTVTRFATSKREYWFVPIMMRQKKTLPNIRALDGKRSSSLPVTKSAPTMIETSSRSTVASRRRLKYRSIPLPMDSRMVQSPEVKAILRTYRYLKPSVGRSKAISHQNNSTAVCDSTAESMYL